MMEAKAVTIDWGTSSFRAWMIAGDGTVLAHVKSGEGLKTAMEAGFETVLEARLLELGAGSELPIVMCGMIGSRQGWVEAKYLDTPTALTNIVSHCVEVANQTRKIFILPGLAQRKVDAPDVIRGEETQLLGASLTSPNGLFCMPGTHSKWVALEAGSVREFSTFMTGELFEVISKHSILSHSIQSAGAVSAGDPSFLNAVQQSFDNPQRIANQLFSLRAGELLAVGHGSISAQLSGMLIGVELAGALQNNQHPIKVIGASDLATLYDAALKHLGHDAQILDAEQCVRDGLIAAVHTLWPEQSILRKA